MSKRLLFALALFAPLLLTASVHAAPRKSAEKTPARWGGLLSPCTIEKVDGPLCGKLSVFENRAARSGRKIELKIVILPATGPDRAPDPLFVLEGGPGGAATDDAAEMTHDPARARRDLVLVDVRGTGGSNPLTCPIWGDGTRLDHIFPLDAVTACRDELQKRADLTQYTSASAMDDLEEARRALGYGKINLYGASYGTYAAQVFAVRHPEALRSIVLSRVAKPGEPSPLYHARSAQQALDLLARDCAAEPACAAAFPHFTDELATVLDRLAKQPARVEVKDPKTGAGLEVELTRSAFADALRWALYNPFVSRQVPLRVHDAFTGNYGPVAQAAVAIRSQLQQGLAVGDLFSVTCAEDLPLIDPRQIPAATQGTFYGDDRVREQLAVCGIWPHAKLPPTWWPYRSQVPTLLLAGEQDPVTPAADAALVAGYFPHSRLVQIPGASHASNGDCEPRLIAAFLDKGSAEGLDLSCLKAEVPPPFATKPAE